MEMLDIVDGDDNVIGFASMDDVYSKFLTHRIVHVLIFNSKGEMALQMRSKSKGFCPLHWSTSVGGHVRSGETYEEAASRESLEEIGTNPEIQFISKVTYETGNLKKILGVFKTVYDGKFKVNEEVNDVKFFSLNQIQNMINDGEKFHPELLFLLNREFGIKKIDEHEA